MVDKRLKSSDSEGIIVAIDGPSGAGKSTVSRDLAKALGGYLLDTGAMYRGVAYHAHVGNLDSEEKISKLARTIAFDVDLEKHILLVNGENLGTKIRTEEIGKLASSMSCFAGVREALTERQRELGKRLSLKTPVVVEGRDIGTVVFPDTPHKFFITAKPEERAKRRLKQLENQGISGGDFEEILKEIKARDDQDSQRKLAPLKCAEDAFLIDTTSITISEVVKTMVDKIKSK